MFGSIFDEILKQVHRVEARANALSQDMLKALQASRSHIVGRLAELQARLLTGAPWEEEALFRRKAFLQAQRAEVERLILEIVKQFEPELLEASQDVWAYTQAQTLATLKSNAIGVEVGSPRLDANAVRAWTQVNMVNGMVLSEWLDAMAADTADKVVQVGRQAMIEGMTVGQTASLLRQRGIEGTRPAIQSLARTYLLSASNYAREQAILGLGADLNFSWLYTATLDGRTCLVCGADDGKLFKKNAARPSVPRHPNCRCTYIPVFGDATLSGVERPATKHDERTVHHRDGSTSTKFGVAEVEHVPAQENYGQWIRRQLEEDPDFVKQVLGRTRFDLLKKGEISLSKMVVDGRIRRLSEL